MPLRAVKALFALALCVSVEAAPPVVRNPRPVIIDGGMLEHIVKANFGGDLADDILVVNGAELRVHLSVPGRPFGDAVPTPVNEIIHAAAVGHFDADAFLDLAVLIGWQGGAIYHGNGDGTFRRGLTFETRSSPVGITTGDFNGDGATDVIVGNTYSGYGVTVNFGNGSGGLGPAISALGVSAEDVSTVDLNHDGRPDLMMADSNGIVLAVGLGDGRFLLTWRSAWDQTGTALGDFDEDGKVDVFTATDAAGSFSYDRGVGDGTFVPSSTHFLMGGVSFDRIRAVDMDGDGHLDVVAAARLGTICVLRGYGNGTFRAAEHWFTDAMTALETGDVDRDGTMDVLYRSGYAGARFYFIRGVGNGSLDAYRSWLMSPPNGQRREVHATSATDIDGDGDTDVVALVSDGYSSSEIGVLLNTGGGQFSTPIFSTVPPSTNVRTIAAGDVNRDGKGDVIAADGVYLGRGDGTFHDPIPLPLPGCGALLAQLDDDTVLDLILTTYDASHIYLGSGTGLFTSASTVPFGVGGTGDFNGDGRADLAGGPQTESFGGARVGINGGNGNFTVTAVDPSGYGKFSAVADFNSDGRLDIAGATYTGSRVMMGRGDGTFGSPLDFAMAADLSWGASAADINGDGAVDLISGSAVHLGDGTGRFPSYAHVLSGWTTQNAVADFDKDGDLDFVVTHANAPSITLVRTNTGPDPDVTPVLTLVSSVPAPRYGQMVEYTARLSPATALRNGGAILFSEDGVPVDLRVVYDEAIFTYRTAWRLGSHDLSARFTGDSLHAPVSQTVHHVVPRNVTSISADPRPQACSAEIAANVSLFGESAYGMMPGPQGDLVFREGGAIVASRKLSYGYGLSGLSAGTHSITVDYAGDANYEPSNSSFDQVITPATLVSIQAGSGVFAGAGGNTASAIVGTLGPRSAVTIVWSITNGTIDSGQGTFAIRYTAGASGEVGLTATATKTGAPCDAAAQVSVPIIARRPNATMLFVVPPCRLLDTRATTPLASSEQRAVVVAGVCLIPSDAKSVVGNVTVISPAVPGWLSLFPAGASWPGTSTVNYRQARTRANQALVPLSAGGQMVILNSGAAVDVLFDVFGYFK